MKYTSENIGRGKVYQVGVPLPIKQEDIQIEKKTVIKTDKDFHQLMEENKEKKEIKRFSIKNFI